MVMGLSAKKNVRPPEALVNLKWMQTATVKSVAKNSCSTGKPIKTTWVGVKTKEIEMAILPEEKEAPEQALTSEKAKAVLIGQIAKGNTAKE